jgi:hypothetical protein
VRRRTWYAAGLAALAAVSAPVTFGAAGARCNPSVTVCDPDNPANPDFVDGRPVLAAGRYDTPLASIRTATRGFRRVENAIAAGYVQFFGCVHEPLAGSMGIHFVKADLVGDTVIDAGRPEALMYEVEADGELSLTGVEYVVFKEAWDAEHAEPPALFGRPFIEVPANNRYGIEPFYELHAWAWKANPNGDFEDWNPRVVCTGTEGHHHGT